MSAKFDEQICVDTKIHIDEFFIRLPQNVILSAALHLIGKAVPGAEPNQTLGKLSPMHRFRKIVKKVLKRLNFKRRAIEKMLTKYRRYKYATYIDLYSRKLLYVNLQDRELDILDRIEQKSSLA